MKNKTRIAVAAALIAGMGTSSALATDLYTPPAGVAVFDEAGTDWSGFYFGVYGEFTHVNVGPGVNVWGVGKRIGYNFDTGNIIFGVEGAAEYQWQTPSWDVQVVGRLGVELGDAALLYATAGVGHVTAPVASNYATVGGGIEYMVTENVSIRGDYKYKAIIPGGAPDSHNFSIGLSYHF